MARRKSDIPKAPVKPPRKDCCPICLLPPEKVMRTDGDKKKTISGCVFFAKCGSLKYDDSPKESAGLRSEIFRMYHAEICPICRKDKKLCREQKVARALRESKKDGVPRPDNLTHLASLQTCKPPDERKYTPAVPDWYVPQPKEK